MNGRTSCLKDMPLKKLKVLELQHPASPLADLAHMTGLRCLSLQGSLKAWRKGEFKKKTVVWGEKYDTSLLALLPCLRVLSLGDHKPSRAIAKIPMLVKTDQDITRLKEMKLDYLRFSKLIINTLEEKIRQAGLFYAHEAIPLALWEEIMVEELR